MAEQKGVSLNPEDAVEGGGLLDDADVLWSEARFETWDYNGKVKIPVPALKISMVDQDTKEEAVQYYSMGNTSNWMPSPDGTGLLPVGKAEGIRASSNGMILIKSLQDAGFPNIGNDVSIFDGLTCHMERVAAPARAGIKKKTNEDGSERTQTILVVTKILAMPGEAKKGSGKKTGGSKKKAAPKDAGKGNSADTAGDTGDAGDAEAVATDFILRTLGDLEKVSKKDLPTLAFKDDEVKGSEHRNAVVKLVYDPDFLSSGPWSFKDDEVSM